MNALILAFDPGPTSCGWAILYDGKLRPSYENAGELDPRDEGCVDALLRGFSERACDRRAVAIETPSGYVHEHARGAQLLATARIAGGIAGRARSLGLEVIEKNASEVRRALGLTRIPKGKMDAAVKRAVLLFVEGWPRQSNSHTRDAAALAMVALNIVRLGLSRRTA